jgi:hypothetical protein
MRGIMIDTVSPALLAILSVLLAWCSVRGWRSKKALLKWAGAGSAALIAVVVFVPAVLMSAGLVQRSARPTISARWV